MREALWAARAWGSEEGGRGSLQIGQRLGACVGCEEVDSEEVGSEGGVVVVVVVAVVSTAGPVVVDDGGADLDRG